MSHLSQPGAISTSTAWSKLYDSGHIGADAGSIDSGAAGFSTALDHLIILAYLRTTQAAVQSTSALTFNNDGGANYDNMRLTVSATTTVSGNSQVAQTSFIFNTLGASALSGAFSTAEIIVPFYAQQTGQKTFGLRNVNVEDTAADGVIDHKGGHWRSTASINRVIIAAGSGNLLAGSRMTIYGL